MPRSYILKYIQGQRLNSRQMRKLFRKHSKDEEKEKAKKDD